MICLSIRQPWASLVVSGRKTIETRIWSFRWCANLAKLHGQRIAIHAGKRLDTHAIPAEFSLKDIQTEWQLGGIICTALLKGHKFYESPEDFSADRKLHLCPRMDEVDFMQLSEDQRVLGLVLADPRQVDFIPCPGRLGFFEVGLHV